MTSVVVVDDSHFMRVQIREILDEHGFDVVAEASNGKEAVETVVAHEPDVVTMDVKMPGMNGIEAVERIMEKQPTPIVMLSMHTEDGSETTFDALAAGAVEFFVKPGGEVSPSLVTYADELAETVSVVADADVSARGHVSPSEGVGSTVPPATAGQHGSPPTVVIAASTGGPPVVESVFEDLPATLGMRVILVQHMPEPFTEGFAERVDERTDLDVAEASEGQSLGPNEGVVAKAGKHLKIQSDTGTDLQLATTEGPEVNNVRPAADVTMESVAETVQGPLVGVVLTGMGEDGAAGAEDIAEVGGTILVQTPGTAKVAGMPGSAIDTGVVDSVLSPAEIPSKIVEVITED